MIDMTREEALKIVRENYPHFGTTEPWLDLEKALATLIPELRESEDERIRKELVAFFIEVRNREGNEGYWHDLKVADILSYLQNLIMANSPQLKEQKPRWEINIPDTTKWTKGMIDERLEELVEEYHKQKPAEWNEEDEEMYARVVRRYTDYEGVIMRTKEESVANKMLNAMAQEEIWLKSLPERFNLQPKNKWSEEDSKRYVSIATTLETSAVLSKEDYDANMSWLRNLVYSQKYSHPQPHKDIYQAAKHDLAIKFMNYLDENRPEGKMSLSNAECEDIDKAFKDNDWGKIIRYIEKYKPQWKPSEEQMEALERTIHLSNFGAEENRRKALSSLLKQLKKRI